MHAYSGEMQRESAEAKAERIIREQMERLGWSAEQLAQRAKGDPAKLAMAARVRTETTQPVRWIAARLRMGTWKSANAPLHHWLKTHESVEQG